MSNKAVPIPGRERDWDWAQVQYETTDHSTTDIAIMIGVPATTLVSRASRSGWTRDKGKLVAQMTADMVLAARAKESELRAREREAIERVNVQMQAEVLTRHRTDIRTARGMCTRFFTELGQDGDLDLDAKSRVLGRLTESMKTLLLLERQAYGISGVFEDVEKDAAAAPAPAATVDAVMSKFAAVLAKRMGAVEVVENDAAG